MICWTRGRRSRPASSAAGPKSCPASKRCWKRAKCSPPKGKQTMPKSLKGTLDFLSDLRENNNREWFAENRKRYDKALAAVETFLSDLFARFTPVEDLGAT